jgi:hyperosmotically inducible periplasmic protein
MFDMARFTKRSALTIALLVTPFCADFIEAQSPDAKTKADNTAVNKRDVNAGAVTADQQKMNSVDRTITAKIRRLIIADKSLSMYAQNVKIVSEDGLVTLKGPVRSGDEVKSIIAKARDVTGDPSKVINQMSVEPASKP